MQVSEIIRQLRTAGHTIGHTNEDCFINSDGKVCVRVDDVVMFQPDAEDLLRGRATLKEIIKRNKGKNLGWIAVG